MQRRVGSNTRVSMSKTLDPSNHQLLLVLALTLAQFPSPNVAVQAEAEGLAMADSHWRPKSSQGSTASHTSELSATGPGAVSGIPPRPTVDPSRPFTVTEV